MLEIVNRVRQQLTELWERQDQKARRRFLVVLSVCVAALIVAVVLLTRTEWAVFRQGLTDEETGRIITWMREQGYPVREGKDPGTLEVPAADVRARIFQLSESGSTDSGYSYDTYQLGSGFGSTDADSRQFGIYQTQELIRGDIMASDLVTDARVSLSIPDRSPVLLQSEVIPATASVILTLGEGVVLTGEQVRVIENMVAGAVSGLTVDNVKITDSSLNLLKGEADEPSEYELLVDRQELIRMVESNLRTALLRLMVLPVGPEHVDVTVKVEMDFDQREVETIDFRPVVGEDSGIAVSMETINEQATAMDPNGAVEGVDANGGNAPVYPEVDTTVGNYSRTVTTANYEVSQTLERLEPAQGRVTGLTCSVVVDQNALFPGVADDGLADAGIDEMYAAFRNIAAGALGVTDAVAAEAVHVTILPFQSLTQQDEMYAQMMAERRRSELFALIKTILPLLLIFIALLIIILQTFGLLRFKPEPVEVADLLTPEQLELIGLSSDGTPLPEDEETAAAEVVRRQNDVREKLDEIINRNPNMAADLLRNWLSAEEGW